MQDSDSDNSNMFKVDHSKQYACENTEKRLDNLFDKDKKILNDDQKRKVVYGALQQQQKTVYQIVQPYLWKAAAVTGQAAVYAGKNIYNALATGATWVYDKFVNTVIPYTVQQLPKLMFIIKGGKKTKENTYSSDSFHVLEIEDGDYQKIKNKQKKIGKKRIIVPLGPNQDPQFIKFLQKQKYVADTSFPIDMQDDQQQTFLIPSANFMVLHNEALSKKQPAHLQLQHQMTQQIQIKKQQKQEQVPDQNEQNNIMKSIVDEKQQKVKEVEDYKKVEKKVFKLKDCYIFQLEGKNSIEYELLDGIERDQNTQCGYLVNSRKFQVGVDSDSDGNSGEVPLLVERINEKKIVDAEMKVRVQIPVKKQNQKIEDQIQKQLQLA